MPRSKYRNIRTTTADGVSHASKLEAKRYDELKLLERAGKIGALERQKPFELRVGDAVLGKYVADFSYFERGQHVVDEAKGAWTPLAKWKRKHFEAQYPAIEFRETRR